MNVTMNDETIRSERDSDFDWPWYSAARWPDPFRGEDLDRWPDPETEIEYFA